MPLPCPSGRLGLRPARERLLQDTTPPCSTVIVALVKRGSMIAPVQLADGQPASAAVGCAGGCVVTLKARLPFLITLAGID